MSGANYILWDVQEEHLDEAAFLFEQWEGALDSPSYVIAEVAAGPEARMLAHVDGLVVGGEPVLEQLLVPVLRDTDADPGYVFVAAHVVLATAKTELCAVILDELEQAEGARWRALVRALELSEREGLGPWLSHGLERCAAPGLAGRLRALSSVGVPADTRAADWLRSKDADVVEATCKWLASGPTRGLPDELTRVLMHEQLRVRQAALDAACIGSTKQIWPWIKGLAESEGDDLRDRGLLWLSLLGSPEIHAPLIAGLDEGVPLWPVSFCGRIAAVEAALGLLEDEKLGPAAGELIQAIAGVPNDDVYWDEARDEPDDEANALPSFEDDDLETEPIPQPEAELRRPRPAAIAEWWSERRGQFVPKLRHLGGAVMQEDSLATAIQTQPCRRRHVLDLEIRARSAGAARVETRALSARQRGLARALPPLRPQAGLA